MNRRDFLVRTAGALAATRFPDPLLPRSPASLGRIGIQLYTVRDQFAKDPEGTLARLAQIGFTEVEFAGYPPGKPSDLRKLLDKYHLAGVSSHVGFSALQSGWDQTLENAVVVGQRFIVVPSLPQSQRRTLDDVKRVAAAFNKAGQSAQRDGLQFCYHNHDNEFPLIEGAVPYDVLLAETDPRLVRFELDLYWITKAGKDPLEYFAKWPGRFPMVHVKDMDATPRQFFADLGKGIIDFPKIFRQAKQAGIQHYLYEQDETPGDVFASAKASYDYLRALRF